MISEAEVNLWEMYTVTIIHADLPCLAAGQ